MREVDGESCSYNARDGWRQEHMPLLLISGCKRNFLWLAIAPGKA
jgi:hypothetical protein